MDDVARAPMIMSVLSYVDLEREPLLLCQRSIDRINLYFLRLISNENPFLCQRSIDQESSWPLCACVLSLLFGANDEHLSLDCNKLILLLHYIIGFLGNNLFQNFDR